MTEALTNEGVPHDGLRVMTTAEGESLFRVMANTAPVLIWVSGQDGLCTFFNDPWLAFTGRTMEQELGSGWAQGVHPEDYQPTMTTYLDAFVERQPFRMEYRLRRADGTYGWLLDTGVPRFGPDGSFAGYIGSCIDLTERKLAEETLRRNEAELERQKVLYETMCTAQSELGDAVVLLDLDTLGVLFVNDAFATLTGYDFTAFRAKVEEDPFDLCAPEDLVMVRRRFAAERRGELVTPRFELAFVHCDGHVIELEIMSKQLAMSGKRVSISILRDVTVRKDAERSAQRGEAHVSAALESVGDGILTVDEAGTIETASATACDLFGFDRLVGMPAATLLPELGVGKRFDLAWLDGGLVHETIGRTSNGRLFPVELTTSEVGEPRIATAIVRDVSERQRLDRQANEANDVVQEQLGRDLRDGVAPLLDALATLADPATGAPRSTNEKENANLAAVVRGVVERIRTLASELAPVAFEGQTLVAVLQTLADECLGSYGVRCSFEHDADPSEVSSAVSPSMTAHLAAIARQAVADAVELGGATKLQMVLQTRGVRRSLLVLDNGNDARLETRAYMRHRAGSIGASLTSVRREPVGTIVECSWTEASSRAARPS